MSMVQRRTISVIDLLSRECLNCRVSYRVAPILTLASSVPIDILLPDGSSRVCELQRNAGARQFQHRSGVECGVDVRSMPLVVRCVRIADPSTGFKPRVLVPLVRDDLKLGDNFSSLDLRVSKVFRIRRALDG